MKQRPEKMTFDSGDKQLVLGPEVAFMAEITLIEDLLNEIVQKLSGSSTPLFASGTNPENSRLMCLYGTNHLQGNPHRYARPTLSINEIRWFENILTYFKNYIFDGSNARLNAYLQTAWQNYKGVDSRLSQEDAVYTSLEDFILKELHPNEKLFTSKEFTFNVQGFQIPTTLPSLAEKFTLLGFASANYFPKIIPGDVIGTLRDPATQWIMDEHGQKHPIVFNYHKFKDPAAYETYIYTGDTTSTKRESFCFLDSYLETPEGRLLLCEVLGFMAFTRPYYNPDTKQYEIGVYAPNKDLACPANIQNGFTPFFIPYPSVAVENYYLNRYKDAEGNYQILTEKNVQNIGKIAPLITFKDTQYLMSILSTHPTTPFKDILKNLLDPEDWGELTKTDKVIRKRIQNAFGIVVHADGTFDDINDGTYELRDADFEIITDENGNPQYNNMAQWWNNYDASVLSGDISADSMMRNQYEALLALMRANGQYVPLPPI